MMVIQNEEELPSTQRIKAMKELEEDMLSI
jgi:hypothetical protein